jgi:hypothetical protein
MKRIARCTLLAVVASLGIISQSALAKGPAIPDVALQDGGVLQGQLLDKSGGVKVAKPVVVTQKGKVVVIAMTDKQGRFSIRGMRGGVHQIESEHGKGVYRLWAPMTAPPVAKSGILMVVDDSVVRGQDEFGPNYGPAIRGAVAGGLLVGGTYWALDHNPSGS